MEEGAKRRLIGAAVIIALLVIFLPMLLEEDGEPVPPVSERDLSIPTRPDFDSAFDPSIGERPLESSIPELPTSMDEPGEQREEPRVPQEMPRELPPPVFMDIPATAEPDLDQESDIDPDPQLAAPTSEPPPAKVEEPRVTAEPAHEPARARKPTPTPSSQPTQPTASPKPTPKRPAITPERPSADDPYTWVIQVASLREYDRAYSLVQDLRDKGFPAYLQEAEVDRKLWHRVRVGPEIERRRIESMASSLEKQTGMKVQIQRYP